MRLERHIGGMGRARQAQYLEQRGWKQADGQWHSPREPEVGLKLSRALHHQLTYDLSLGLSRVGWRIVGYSARGYAQLLGPGEEKPCTLPSALRKEARRAKRKVGEFTYELFLAAVLEEG